MLNEFFDRLIADLPDNEIFALQQAAEAFDEFIGDGQKTSETEDEILFEFLQAFYERVYQQSPDISVGSPLQGLQKLIVLIQRRRATELVEQYFAKKTLPEEGFGFAELSPDEKSKIHAHIERVREIINASGLSEKKKRKLFDRLNLMAKEVDRPGTRTDEFVAFMTDIGFALSGFAQGGKPALDETREMVTTILNARARKEGVALNFRGKELLSLELKGVVGDEDSASEGE